MGHPRSDFFPPQVRTRLLRQTAWHLPVGRVSFQCFFFLQNSRVGSRRRSILQLL
jgi:hypothetical protein